jgi:undecaprenyl-diphosphatase
MITYFQSIILGLLQGFTELFPISSLGHSVLLPSLLGWNIDQHAPFFIVFLVATHLATALVLLAFFFKDWIWILQGFLRSILHRGIDAGDTYARLAWLIIFGTIPAGLLGLIFQKKLGELFASPHIVAVFLLLNGVLLYFVERFTHRGETISQKVIKTDMKLSRLSFGGALIAGCMQALALFPGFSRTGAALSGGLIAGLPHESAARFSFLLATPIIFAAAVLKLPVLFTQSGSYPVGEILVGAVASALAATFSIIFLTKYFKTKTMKPFAIYCMVAGATSLVLFLIK